MDEKPIFERKFLRSRKASNYEDYDSVRAREYALL